MFCAISPVHLLTVPQAPLFGPFPQLWVRTTCVSCMSKPHQRLELSCQVYAESPKSHSSGGTELLRPPLAPWWTRYFPKNNTSFSSSCAFTVNSWFITYLRGRTEGKERLRQTQGRFDLKEAQHIATDSYLFRAVRDKPPLKRQRLRPRKGKWSRKWPMV